MNNFDLKKFLIENKLTSNSRMLSEDIDAAYAICHVEGEFSAPNGEIVDFEEYILIEIVDSENFDETDDSTYDVLEQGELSMEDQEHFIAWNNGDDLQYDLRRYSVEEVVERFNTLDQAQEVFETKYRDSKNVYETKTTSNSRLNENDGSVKYGVLYTVGKMLTDYGQMPYKEVVIVKLEPSEYGDLEFEGESYEEIERFDPETAFQDEEHYNQYLEDEDILFDSERSYHSVDLEGVFDSYDDAQQAQEEVFEDWENLV